MNEFLRAVARVCGITAQDMVQCVGSRLLWCPCGVAFCGRGAALVAAQETQRLLRQKPNRRSGAPGRTVGEVVDKFEETAA